jgi:tRNA-splicing ligase RtcB
MDRLDHVIPRGVGHGGVWRLHDRAELDLLLTGGARYAVERGHGVARDLDRCEDAGAVSDADPAQVSSRAAERGLGQVGSLGSGNHFLEVQAIDHVYDATAASAMGLQLDQVCVMIHCGSRGSGPSDLYRSCADDGEGHGRVRHLRT